MRRASERGRESGWWWTVDPTSTGGAAWSPTASPTAYRLRNEGLGKGRGIVGTGICMGKRNWVQVVHITQDLGCKLVVDYVTHQS